MLSLSPIRLFTRHGSRRSHPFAAGSYLTDGRRLFRVVAHFTPGTADVCARLEDCLTLEVHEYAPRQLYSMRLRLVRGVAVA